MEVVYITGQARCGKSYLAKKLAEKNGMSLYETSNGEHPFDDYMGQDAILIDDIRPSDFKFNELLKILDNHMSAKASARYHNVDLNCKVMYLTSTVPLSEFYENLRKEVKEASEQLTGRIGMMIEVRKKSIDIYVYNKAIADYEIMAHDIPNPILTDEQIHLMTAEEQMKIAVDMFRGIADITKYAADAIDKGQIKIDDFMPIPKNTTLPFEE